MTQASSVFACAGPIRALMRRRSYALERDAVTDGTGWRAFDRARLGAGLALSEPRTAMPSSMAMHVPYARRGVVCCSV